MPDAVTAREAERGQTLPFWVFSILMSFALVFFVFNYTYTTRYQVRAQNAADSAAVAALAQDANAANSVQTLLYALSVQEFTVRGVDAAIKKLLQDPTNCTGGVTSLGSAGNCLTNYTTLVNEYATEQQKYAALLTQLTNANATLTNLTNGGLQDPNSLVRSFFANNCVNLNTDCSFRYTTNVDVQPTLGAPIVITETACETVPMTAAGFLGLQRSTFYALGRTRASLAPVTAVVSPGNSTTTGLGAASRFRDLLPHTATSGGVSAYNLDLAGLSATTGYIEPTTAGTSTDPVDFSKQC